MASLRILAASIACIIIVTLSLPVRCQDMSPQVAASIQALLNEETILRTKMENELRELNSDLAAFQALRNNGKSLSTS